MVDVLFLRTSPELRRLQGELGINKLHKFYLQNRNFFRWKFYNLWSSKPWIRIWVRISIQTNADPQQCFGPLKPGYSGFIATGYRYATMILATTILSLVLDWGGPGINAETKYRPTAEGQVKILLRRTERQLLCQGLKIQTLVIMKNRQWSCWVITYLKSEVKVLIIAQQTRVELGHGLP